MKNKNLPKKQYQIKIRQLLNSTFYKNILEMSRINENLEDQFKNIWNLFNDHISANEKILDIIDQINEKYDEIIEVVIEKFHE